MALAVGLTPEFLPMITSVTLARGAVRMAREQVVVKHLPAIQNFGSIDVFCSDKTGTLTTGRMMLGPRWILPAALRIRPLALAYLNSKFETGIRSPLDAAILKARPAGRGRLREVDEIPFDFNRRRLSIVVENDQPEGDQLLITKGAPEGIVGLCDSVRSRRAGDALSTPRHGALRQSLRGLCEPGLSRAGGGVSRGSKQLRRTSRSPTNIR